MGAYIDYVMGFERERVLLPWFAAIRKRIKILSGFCGSEQYFVFSHFCFLFFFFNLFCETVG